MFQKKQPQTAHSVSEADAISSARDRNDAHILDPTSDHVAMSRKTKDNEMGLRNIFAFMAP